MSASKSDKIGEMLDLRKGAADESRSDRIGKILGLIPEDAEEGGASPVKVLILGVTVISALAAIWLFYTSTDSSIINDVPNVYVAGLISITGALLLMFL
ncbi:MAG: hypothetical protein QF678_05745, partial [Candidatus Poseidoniia archaeon]|nr:hypothetical protein [Candidatus Poseidoniia archaeon]